LRRGCGVDREVGARRPRRIQPAFQPRLHLAQPHGQNTLNLFALIAQIALDPFDGLGHLRRGLRVAMTRLAQVALELCTQVGKARRFGPLSQIPLGLKGSLMLARIHQVARLAGGAGDQVGRGGQGQHAKHDQA
jgi:hypothetical protein